MESNAAEDIQASRFIASLVPIPHRQLRGASLGSLRISPCKKFYFHKLHYTFVCRSGSPHLLLKRTICYKPESAMGARFEQRRVYVLEGECLKRHSHPFPSNNYPPTASTLPDWLWSTERASDWFIPPRSSERRRHASVQCHDRRCGMWRDGRNKTCLCICMVLRVLVLIAKQDARAWGPITQFLNVFMIE